MTTPGHFPSVGAQRTHAPAPLPVRGLTAAQAGAEPPGEGFLGLQLPEPDPRTENTFKESP